MQIKADDNKINAYLKFFIAGFIFFSFVGWLLRYNSLMPLAGVYVCANIKQDTIFVYDNNTWERKHWLENKFILSKGDYRFLANESRIEFYGWRSYEDNPVSQEITNLSVPIYYTWLGCFKYLGISGTGDNWFDFHKS